GCAGQYACAAEYRCAGATYSHCSGREVAGVAEASALNEYSAAFIAWLLGVRPAWAAYARPDSEAVAGAGAVVVDLPNPQPGRPGLLIETDGDWITVCFDRMHANFHAFAQPGQEAWAEALAFVDALMKERVAVAVTMRGGTLAEWRLIRGGEPPQ